jgi:hypothetical protein
MDSFGIYYTPPPCASTPIYYPVYGPPGPRGHPGGGSTGPTGAVGPTGPGSASTTTLPYFVIEPNQSLQSFAFGFTYNEGYFFSVPIDGATLGLTGQFTVIRACAVGLDTAGLAPVYQTVSDSADVTVIMLAAFRSINIGSSKLFHQTCVYDPVSNITTMYFLFPTKEGYDNGLVNVPEEEFLPATTRCGFIVYYQPITPSQLDQLFPPVMSA